MTTIAYRDGVLAADSQVTSGAGTRDGAVTKGLRVGGVLAAAAGGCGSITAFLDWVRGGCRGDVPDLGENTEALLITANHVLSYEGGRRFMRMSGGPTAIGSGARLAIGAMEAGASAQEAVEIAARRDVYTGGDIRVLSIT